MGGPVSKNRMGKLAGLQQESVCVCKCCKYVFVTYSFDTPPMLKRRQIVLFATTGVLIFVLVRCLLLQTFGDPPPCLRGIRKYYKHCHE